jgi:DNA-binding MarR family transcriptional regulator
LARLVITLRRETAAGGLSRVQLTVLAALNGNGPRRITDLAALEQITQPSMTALISRMERVGWVCRESDPQDRRAVLVRITPDGQRQYEVALSAYVAALGQRLRRLQPAEQNALRQAIFALDVVLDGTHNSLPDIL